MVLAVPLDRGQPVEDLAPAEAAAGGGLQPGHELRRQPVRVRGQRLGRHDAHQLPVAGRRVLARAEVMEDTVKRGVRGPRHPANRPEVAEAQALERGQLEPADRVGDVAQRVRARVAVVRGVGLGTGAEGVDHDHEGAAGVVVRPDRTASTDADTAIPRIDPSPTDVVDTTI